MRILILGGAGFLGTHLAFRCLNEPGTRLTLVDSLDPIFHSTLDPLEPHLKNLDFIQGDIRQEEQLRRWVQGQDIIFNCAAQSSHIQSIQNPTLDAEINATGHLKLLEAVRLYNPKAVVIYPSTSTVIGRARQPVVDETHPEVPLGIYSAHKVIGEKYSRIYQQVHGIKTVILRFSNLYGPFGKNRPEFGFMNYFIHLAQKDQTIPVFGVGDQSRNTMFVEDAVDLLWRAALDPRFYGQVFFATSPFHHTVREIAENVVKIFESGRIEFSDWPEDRKSIEVGPVRFSSRSLESLVGWRARFDLEAGLQKTKAILTESSASRFLAT